MESKKVEYDYVPLSESNLHWFIPLFKAAFKKDITLAEVKKKYDFTGMHKPYLGLFACDNGRPIAFIGICYYVATYRGKKELASNFTDSMVHPEYQGKSVYIKLLNNLKEVAKENGICFSLGFPNDNSYAPVVKKGNWLVAIHMVGFILKGSSMPIRKIARKMNMETAYLKWAEKKLKPYLVPYNEQAFIESNESFHIIHDEFFFYYKQTPAHFLLRIDDTFVWIKLDNYLSVGFLGELEEDKILKVTNELKRIAKKLYMKEVMLQFTKDTPQDLILTKHYKKFESWPVLYFNQQSNFPAEQLQLQYCDVDSF